MWNILEKLIGATARKITPRQRTGLWGEGAAEKYLKRQGYQILGRRFRVGPKDEIDLIARHGDTLIFIEVKTRSAEDFGRPRTAVDRAKQHHLARAAVRYLQRLKARPASFRFDVVEIVGGLNCPRPVVRHIENAFPLPRYFRVP